VVDAGDGRGLHGVVVSDGLVVTRTSRDVSALSRTVRFAVPETLIAVVTVGFVVGALILVGPLLALPCLIAVPVLWAGTRYRAGRRRATCGERRLLEITDGISECAGRGPRRCCGSRPAAGPVPTPIPVYAAERYTSSCKMVFFPVAEIGYVVPVVATLTSVAGSPGRAG
jgi:ABC-type multidrug transport system fused ATPase/permease subunit